MMLSGIRCRSTSDWVLHSSSACTSGGCMGGAPIDVATDFRDLLRAFADHDVRFLIVGHVPTPPPNNSLCPSPPFSPPPVQKDNRKADRGVLQMPLACQEGRSRHLSVLILTGLRRCVCDSSAARPRSIRSARPAVASYRVDQSSKRRPGTRAKSRWLRVTTMRLWTMAVAAMRKSWLPSRSRKARSA